MTAHILAYIDDRIATYKKRADALYRDGKIDHAHDLRVGAQTLGVLRGDLTAGLHMPDAPPGPVACAHPVEIAIMGAGDRPGMWCEACGAFRQVPDAWTI